MWLGLPECYRPHNHFEIAGMRDRALHELQLPDLSPSDAVRQYAVELLESALNGGSELLDALTIIKDLCIANDYQSDIQDFYLLYFAYCDLQETDNQYYWPDATRENIVMIIHERADAFVRRR